MDNATRSKLLNEAVDLINKADVLVQQVMEARDECYYIHTQLENAADDIVDVINTCDDDTFEETYD